ncbi:5-guanidino-2-oxopentanoate decarboxylase [Defluviimonas sp. WL0002]|uniref:5-guanidino-2-oxopentanoate decarboxylase n=1 Tax=Albidovulum marisflavi TaxID=2984159 RepID=A0ABT2ZAH6_9RHOB|nr:5-guanidino-2-oxopentanoate decarboxylase [Defluviimonas sp. WL0002]MCV2868139.1 5-guanidino-2-oxopentanoate decarboxylase [Defluviimonas sp. WL0002]
MVERPLGAQLSHMLKSRGVEVIFGIPGVHNVELYRGIEEAGLTHVLARHEQGAGFMADGYARATGRPGVAYVITGPGLTNILTPLGQAYSDSVPVLAISSCLNRADLGVGRARLHEMKDQEGAAATVCDWSRTAMDAATAYQLVDRAFAEFAAGRPRPKHMQVPIEVLGALAPEFDAPRALPARPVAADLSAAIERIARAERPLFVFGGGARAGWQAARRVLAKTRAASIVTYAGRGIVAPGDPLSLGNYLARPDAERMLSRADLIIAIGTELSEVDAWRPRALPDVPLLRVDIDPAELFDDSAADLAVLGDAGAFLSALADALPERASSGWNAAEIAAARARWRAETDAERPGIVRVVDALRDCLPKQTRIYSDMTQFAYVAKEVWDMPEPGLWHHPFGFGTLGYALPAAIGGKVGLPGEPVVAIAGDYGLQYTIQELGTAVELGLPLPILVWDNGKLKEIEESMVRSQIAPNAVVARNPDFVRLAEAYGANAVRPGSIGDLQSAVHNALSADGPTLIHMTQAMV